jgi:hypothetical protein
VKPYLLHVKIEVTTGEWKELCEPVRTDRLIWLPNLWLALRLAAGFVENVFPAEKITVWIGPNTDE